MRAECIFTVSATTPVDFEAGIEAGLPVGIFRLDKTLDGPDVRGRCVTQFSYAFDPEREIGTYVALETFEGDVHGRTGTMVFLHSASTDGASRTDEVGRIVPHSGTGALEGITGEVRLRIDDDDTHHFDFDYVLA